MPFLNVDSRTLRRNTEQGEEAEGRKKKAFWLSIVFVTVLMLSVIGVFAILQILRKKDDESVENGNSTISTTESLTT